MRTVELAGLEARRAAWPGARDPSGVPVFRAPGLLGNLRLMRQDPVDLIAGAHAACGDAVLLPVMPSVRVYSFGHPDAVKQIVLDPEGALVRGRAYAWLRRDLGMAMLVSDGEEHAWRRAALQPAFTRQAVTQYGEVIARSAAETVRRWRRHAGGAPIDVHEELNTLALRVIGEVMFGDDFTAEAEQLQRLFGESTLALGELISTVSQMLPRWVPTPINRRLERLRRELEPLLSGIIERRMRERRATPDLVGHMTCPVQHKSAGPAPRAYATSKEILDEVKGVIGAGHETTANLLTWTVYFLATQPEADRALAEEVRSVAGDRPVRFDDLPRLPYVRRVVHESLRLMPPSWAVLREAAKDVEIGGVQVKRGAFVICSPYVTQRDPRWYPQPLRFLPERDELYPEPPSFAFFPFAKGPMYCIGKDMAEVEGQMIVAELARNFRFRLDAGRFVTPVTRVAVKPAGGLPLSIEPRTGGAPSP